MEKIDYKKQLKQFYSGKVGDMLVVEVPSHNFLMIDGHGDPNTSKEYIDAIQALYPVAYTLKFMSKRTLGKDFAVMPLEGLWWSDNMDDFLTGNKSNWNWTMMILQPEFITNEMFEAAKDDVAKKKNPKLIDRLRLESYTEGRAAQVMYVGAYSDEGPTIKKLHEFIAENDGKLEATNKHHHEIYLGDPRRTSPDKLKTIIRQPF
ncbi:MAG TPA: GyrI-like domain-containing protein [Candidatus Saccharibacteria bacterium]|nr:GyrI-like domain-containing protein [Candidatus Saccharibacteria bacterium]